MSKQKEKEEMYLVKWSGWEVGQGIKYVCDMDPLVERISIDEYWDNLRENPECGPETLTDDPEHPTYDTKAELYEWDGDDWVVYDWGWASDACKGVKEC